MRLNVATRRWHGDVDEPWLDLLHPTVSRTNYLTQLVRTYGFVAPFESACKYTPSLERVLDFHQLSRAGLIAQDLLSLGLAPAQIATIPQCHAMTTFRDVREALGWLYVVERATLLHDGIHRHLLAHLPQIESSCAYLSAFDGRVGDHWNTFGRTLDRVGAKPDAALEIMAAANAGFACMKQWFRNIRFESRSAG